MGDVMRALNSMQNKLGDIIYTMKKEINGINDSVNIITNGSVNLSDRANSQTSLRMNGRWHRYSRKST